MAQKKKPEETIDLLVDMFQDYPWSEIVRHLKNGACLQAIVEGQEFCLEKTDGVLEISEGAPESPDISVELNRDTCVYLAAASDPDDIVTRTRECMGCGRDSRSLSYSIDASPPRMLLKGYLEFARKMGLL
jgi:hypothetical protein